MAREFDFYPLEDRILLSGDGLDASEGASDIDLDLAAALLQQIDDADGTVIDPTTLSAPQSSENDDTSGVESTHTIIDAPAFDPANPIEVVFVDSRVEDADTLLANLRDSADDQTQWLIIRLDAARDGIQQISETMASITGVDAIHLLSHGDGESIQLGSTRLDVQTSQTYVSDIARWGLSLDADADILIYGCDLASTESGRELIQQIAAVCDCDVAASDDATGSELLGGDWDLEYKIGEITTEVFVGAYGQESWRHVLATTTIDIQQGVNGYTGTHDTELRQQSASSNYGNNSSIAIDLDNSGGSTESQGMIRFNDIFGTGSGQIPYGVQIVSASLTVQTTGNTSGTISLYKMLTSWDESTATWNSLNSGLSANGTEMASVADASLTNLSSGAATFTNLKSTVQAWASGAANYGWGILTNTSDGWDMSSSEGTTTPKLSVQYIQPGTQASTAHTITVTTANDTWDGDTSSIDALLANKGADGLISLREAIMAANNTQNDGGTADQINFAISGTGVHTINLGSSLTITDAVNIDATTDDSFAANGNRPAIILDGNNSFTGDGVVLTSTADGSTIRGFGIRDFSGDGIEIQAGSDGNTIVGNYIGRLTSTGSDAGVSEANTANGILVYGSNTIIGGTSAGDGNVISGNAVDGIRIDGAASGTLVQGNYIGTNGTGTAAIGNGDDGVSVMVNTSNNTIGGSTAGARNIISGNAATAIYIEGSSTVVQGNYLGTDVTGTVDLGNTKVSTGEGTIRILNATGATIGGTDAANEGNIIAFGGGDGILLQGSSTGIAILGNSIHSHAGLGIDLGDNGVTTNDGQFSDTPDQDTGANNLQNFPVLSSITAGPTPAVFGSLKSTPSRTFRIEFFANSSSDASGYGEGQRFIDSIEVTTNATGDAAIGHYLDGLIATGEIVSATATDLTTNETSEFAANIVATNSAPVLDSGQSPVLTAQNEDSGPPSGSVGTLISSLVDFASPSGQVDNVTDSNLGAALGIAITAANTTNGSWYYSTNGGSSWSALGAVSDTSARLLAADANTRLYFQPSANYNGTIADAITFRAWDQTTGSNGGTSAITLSPDNVLDTFSSVSYSNNNGSQSWSAGWVESDSSGGAAADGRFKVSGGKLAVQAANTNDYIYREVDLSDADSATLSFSYTSGLGASATIHAQISNNGGASYSTLSGGVFNSSTNTGSGTKSFDISGQIAANTRVRFLVVSGETGAGNNSFSIDNVEIAYTSPGGGTTAFSSEIDTASLVINAVNDAPVLSSGSPSSIVVSEDSSNSTAVSLGMSGLSYGPGGGSDESGQTLTYTITNIPSHITLWRADGTTQVNNNATLTLSELQGLKYKTVADAFGSGNLTWTVQDSGGTANGGTDTLTQSLAITVNAVNDAPVAVDDSYSVDENGTLVVGPSTGNLVNHWEMNEGGSNQTTADSGSLGNDATLGADASANTDDPAWTSGHIGSGGLSFDGSSDYVATSSTVLKTATSFTLSTWFQTDKTSGQQHILWQGYSGGNGYGSGPGTAAQSEMGLTIGTWDQPNKLVFFMGYDVPTNGADPIYIVSNSDFTDTTQFHNVAVVVTDLGGGTYQASLYVDGVLEGTDTGTENDRSAWGSLQIGKPGANTRYFDGQIDDVRIYDTALSETEVQNIAHSGVLQNDTDIDSTPLSVNTSLVTGPSNGTLSINADGSFRYTPDTNFSGTDTFTYQTNDGTQDSNVATVTITVNSVNDAPVTTASGGTTAYSENANSTVIDSALTISDADLGDFDGGSLSVTISANGSANDRLTIVPGGNITMTGTNVYHSGVLVGSVSGGIGTSPLVISFNANSTPGIAQEVGRQIGYFNVSDNPATTTRTVDFVVTDGDGGTSNTAQQQVSVAAVADAPIAVDDHHGLSFDGVDDYVSLGSDSDIVFTNTMTMEVWARPTAYPAISNVILNKEGEYEIGISSTGSLMWAFANTTPGWSWHDTGYVLQLNEWAHISVTYDNGTINTYVNGNNIETYYGSGAIGDAHPTKNDLRVGSRENGPAGQYFAGEIDDVRLWSTVRTQSEIQNNLDTPLTGVETGLAGYWNFNEGAGLDANDLTGNSAKGTLIGGPSWTGFSTDQDTAISINATNGAVGNDIDGEGDTLTISQVQGSVASVGSQIMLGSGALVTVNADGSFDYDPNGAFDGLTAGETGTDSFTYTVSDGSGGTDTATVTITVNGIDDAPTIVADSDVDNPGNQVIDFQGGDDTIMLSGLPVNTAAGTDVTVEFWMNWDGVENVMPFGFGSYDLWLTGGNFGFNTGSGDLYGISSAGLANGWHHVTAVFRNGDATGSRLIIDGVEQTMTQRLSTPSNGNAFAASSAKISGWNNNSTYKFDGQIDQVRIWNGGRSETQVRADMFTELSGPQTGLVASYSFTGATTGAGGVIDDSGNGHHGTMGGMTAANVISGSGFANLGDQTVNEDDLVTLEVSAFDPENSALTYTWTQTSGPAVTLSDANAEKPTFTAINQPADYQVVFTVDASDGTNTTTETVTITVNAINDAPSGVNNTVGTLEDTDITFTAADFGFSDAAENHNFNAVRITSQTASGTLYVDADNDGVIDAGETVVAGNYVSIADINAGRLKYKPLADENGTAYAEFTFQVQDDGGTSGGGQDTDTTPNTMTINVTAVNDAPVLDNTGAMNLSTISKYQTDNDGQSVASIIASAGGDRITDPDAGDGEGIAITSLSSGNGTWQYSTDGGSSWNAIGTVTDSSALLLRDTDLVRFVPNPASGTTANFTFRAWDQTSGTEGTKVDVSTNGDATPFSTASETASITVVEANAAPELDSTKNPALDATNEDAGVPSGAVGTLVSSLVDTASPSGQVDNVSDADSGAALGIAITAVDTTNGTWFYSIDDGSTWNALGAVSDANARLLAADAGTRVYFQPNADYFGTLANAITFRAWDQTSGSNGGVADTSFTSGTYLDTFSAVSYSNNNGSLSWSTDWIENDSGGGGASGGKYFISGGLLNVGESSASKYIYREANLSSASTATLSFDLVTNNLGGGGAIHAQVSSNGGSTWTTLLAVTSGTATGTKSFDISSYIASNTQIRFYDNNGGGKEILVDNVQIAVTTSLSGGTTAFSSDTDTASMVVNPVADTPSVTNATTDEDTQSSSGLVITRNAADGAEVTYYKITGITSGTLYKNDGVTQIANGSFITVAEGAAGLKFTPDADFNGTGNFTIQSSTSGDDTGLGGSTTVANVTVDPVNDAPVNTIPGAQSVNEDATLVFSSGNSNQISIADVDAGSNNVRVELNVDAGGVLTLSQTTGLTFSSGDGSADANMIFTGTVANINAALNGLSFVTTTNYNGPVNLTVTTNDLGNTGSDPGATGDGTSEQDSDVVAITVNAVNDTPVVNGPGSALSATEQVGLAIEGTGFTVTDVDAASGTMTATINVGEGAITVAAGDSGVSISGGNGSGTVTITGTLSQLDNLLTGASTGTITYLNSSDTPSASTTITVTVNDGGNTGADPGLTADGSSEEGSASQTINITATNDDPTNPGGLPSDIVVTEDVSGNVDLSQINLNDVDHGGGNLTVTLTTATGGNLSAISGGGVTIGGSGSGTLTLTGTLANLNTYLDTASNIQYLHSTANLNGNNADTITVTVNDNGNTGTGGGSDINLGTVNVDITAVNDAPELDNSETFTLTDITEDQTNNSGNTVASIIASLSGNRITDVDASPSEGIAIRSISGGNGTWQYSLDGSTWTDVGTVTTSTSLLLRSSDYLRYVPDAMNADTSSVSFVAWDQTTGTEGTKVNTTATGGSTAFSDNVGLAQVTVTAENDAPTITDSATVSLPGTNEDTPSTPTDVNSILASAGWADVDTGAIKGIAVTADNSNGNWQYSTDGTNWTSFSGITSSNALLLSASTQIRYQPDSLNGETATFDFVAWDTTTGSASSFGSPSYADPGSGGGTTAYSSETATASTVVTDVNDAVVAVADSDTATEAGGVANATAGSNPSGNVLSNDIEYDTGDTLNVTGVAAGTVASAAGNVGTSVTGTYGDISIDANGDYTYTVDNNNAIVQALRTSGQTITDTFTYTVQDSGGSYSSTQIVITIEGQNDAPVAVTDNVVAVEAGGDNNASSGTNPTGNVLTNDTDVDSGDTKTVTGVAVGTAGSASGNVASALAGSYGSITINANGSYTYNVDNNNAAVQALRTSSDTLQDVFTYTMQDTDGASSTTQVTVTIQGQNDDPVAVDDNAIAVEAGGTSNGTAGTNPTGNVLSNDTDVDAGDTKTVVGVAVGSQSSASGSVASTVTGSYGSIQIDANGAYSYTVDNSNSAVQALRTSGQSLSEVFTYTIQDASGADSTAEITVTITGANDAPDAVANAATATEASGILNNISGTDPSGNVLTNDTDVDAGDTKTVTGVATGVQGSTSGNVGSTVVGTYGSLVINANGSYTYTLDNDNAAVEALNDGDSLSETFSYTMQDTGGLASTTQLVITIDGRTDLPVAEADHATSEEAGGVNNTIPGSNPSGNVLDNDASNNGKTVVGVAAGSTGSASGNVGTSVTGTYGTVVINTDGTYTYTLDNSNAAVEALLTSGDHVTDIFTYTMEDAFMNVSSTELTITVDGQNDAPVTSDDTSIAVESGGVANATAGSNATGNVLTNDTDVDAGDTKSVIGVELGTVGSASGSVGASVTGNYGQIVINSDGSYTYTINQNNAAVQALRTASDTLQEVYTYTMHDTAGLESTAQVTVTIQGANDAPVAVVDTATAYEAGGAGNGSAGADPSGNVLSNDTDVDSGDTKTVVGVAAGVQGSAAGSVGSIVAGSYGSITLNSDGSYTYNVDNDNAAVQNLRTSGECLNDIFTYTMEDTDGLSSTTQITVAVRGANDNPDVVADTATAVEAGGTANGTAGTNPTGNVLANDSDSDAGDTIVVSGVTAGVAGSATGSVGSSVAGLFGSINIASNGNYSYTVDNNNPTVQDLLNSGDTLTDIFTYTVEDLSGATSTTQVTITIQGANDAPVATVDSAHAYEAGGIANGTAGTDPSGNVLTNDDQVDAGDTWSITGAAQGVVGSTSGSVGSSITGNFGAITINSDGSYTYNIDNDNATVQGLRTASDTITDVFSYTVSDAAGLNSTAQITITLHGANDDPIAVVDTPIAVSAGGYSGGTAGTDPTGNVLTNDTDVDSGDTKTVDGVAAGVQASASGSVGSSVTGSYGSISIAANGVYTYTVDNNNAAVQALRTSSDTLTDVFTYTMIDASGAASTTQVSVTIQGANDAPIGVDDTATAVESGGVANATAGTNPTGNVLTNDTDLDSGDTKTVSGVAAGSQVSASGSVATGVTGSYGQITINSDGSYSYVVDNNNTAVQALRTSGDTLTDVFTYTMVDTAGLDSTAEITVTIQGSNDNPVATADTPTAVEAGGLANGTAGTDPTGNVLSNDTDVDAGDSKTVAGVAAGVQASASGSVGSSVTGSYGSVTINSDGSYTYVVDNSNAAVQALRTASDTLQDVFTYTVVDASGADATTQVTITIQGQNDTPTAVVDNAVAVEAGGTANGTAGTNPTGNVLANDTDVDSFGNGETKSVSGVAAGVAGSASGSVASSVAGSYGAITINSDGSYSYVVDNSNTDVQALRNSGDTLDDVFTYTMTDTAGATSTTQITVTIQGQNDAPTAVADNPIAVESGGLANGTAGTDPTGNVLANDLDPDSAANGETKTVTGVAVGVTGSASGSVATSVTGSYGAITINSDGSYAYVVDNSNTNVQALRNSGQTLDDVFTYTMTDADGVASTTQVTVTIQGQNDTPTAVADNAVAVEAGGAANGTAGTNPTGNVLANDTDVDSVGNGETKSVSGVAAGVTGSASGSVASSVAGSYGAITINSDGSYSYVVDNSNTDVQALRNNGDTLDDVFTYTMTDTAGATSTTQITVTIQGQNDAPTAVADNPIAVESGGLANGTAGTDPTGNVLSNDLDPDSAANGETKTVTGVAVGVTGSASGSVATSVTGSYGAITINADGSYAYVVDNSNTDVQALRNSGQTLEDVFTYTMTDADGVASTTQVTVTIQGQNDTPTAVVDNAVAVEAGGTANGTAGTNPTGNVLTNDTDVDSVGNGETQSVSGVAAGVTGSASGSVASSVAGSYGAITINSDGSYSYVVDNSNTDVQALRNSGDTLDDVFTYTMTDTAGATSTTQITVTIQGQNDAPTAVADNPIAVESGGLANGTAGTDPTGNVLTNDLDPDAAANGETKTVTGVTVGVTGSASGSVATSVTGSYGAITINSDGSYAYVVDNSNTNVQALRNSGQTLDDVFTYTMTDADGVASTTQVTVTIQGQNDTPTAVVDNAVAVEAGGTANGTAGTNPTGNVLTNDTDVDSVGNGETKSVSGVAAGVTGSASGSVASSVTGTYGAITINSDGSYSYIVDNNNVAVQALRNSGQTLDDVFTYTMTDAAGATSSTQITVTIQGQNDTPTAVVDNAVAVESGGLANGTAGSDPTGNVLTNDTDVDSVGNGETKTVSGVAAGVTGSASGSVASSVTGAYGAITINSDGSYSYVVDNSNVAVQALRNSGDTLDDVFTYTMTDTAGATSTTQITVTIQGQNDAPTAVSDNATAVEAGGLANGTAGTDPTGNVLTNDTDVDSPGNGETKTVSGVAAGVTGSASGSVASSVTGSYGAITINSDGSYSYIVDNSNADVQALRNSGQTLDDVFTYTMTDAAGLTSTTQITVTIQGQNDTPTAVVDNAVAVEAGGSANGTAGTDPTGNVLTNDTDVDSVGNGETKTVSGVAAGVTGSASGSVASSVAGAYGAITINSDGSYSYIVDNNNAAVGALRNSGDTLDDVFTYTMTDANGATSTTQITVTIQGQNDTPVANTDNATAVEAGGVANGTAGVDPTGNVLTNDTDADSVGNGETKTVSGVVAGTAASASGSVGSSVSGSYGAITINADGSYSYVVDNSNTAVEALRTATDTLTDVFTYTMVDAAGAQSTQQVTITIQGQNDAPHDLTATGMTIDEGLANGQIVGTVSTDDLDTSDSTLYTLTDSAGGRFSIDASGNVRVADSSRLDYESATQHDITVRVQDAAGATYDETFTVYLNDVNEFNVSAATDTDGNPNQVNENAAFGTTVGITALAIDPDGSTNSVTYSLSDNAGGRFAIDSASGIVTVSGAVDYETASSHTITVRADSSDGSFSFANFSIAVIDVNEAPVASGDNYSINAGETLTLVAPGVLINDSDVDGDSIQMNLISGPSHGVLSTSANGSLVYTPYGAFFGSDTFTYVASDGSLNSNAVTVTITVLAGGGGSGSGGSGGSGSGDSGSGDSGSGDGSGDTSGSGGTSGSDSGDGDSSDGDAGSTTTGAVPLVPANVTTPNQNDDTSTEKGQSKPSTSSVSRDSTIQMADTNQEESNHGFERQGFSWGGSSHMHMKRGNVQMSQMLDQLLVVDLVQAIQWTEWNNQSSAVAEDSTFFGAGEIGGLGVGAGLASVGYVLWALRGGVLLTTIFGSMPAWRMIDPSALLSVYRESDGVRKSKADVTTFLD
ncbi:VCBS domain-containing protein [Novipirellula rosea]|uniref:Cadherin domain-containing protein n=1 Tax=Novipirellula rosea TaxID=1031540 RepID=A0ABP8M5B7_9BACT